MPGAPPPDDRLDSWKEIAVYLKRDATTVQRWERREGMPVHRHLHGKLGSVYAFRAELDAWAQSRNLPLAADGVEADAGVSSPGPVTVPGATARRSRRSIVIGAMIAAAVVAAGVSIWLLHGTRDTWRNPIAGARYQRLDFDGTERAAAISRDGKFVAFLSDRDGRPDVWVTQVGTGQFYNLTRGAFPQLVNPSIRAIGFSPDGSLVTFWTHRPTGTTTGEGEIGIWAVPTLGGEPRPYIEGAAEFEWSDDGSRLVYHTPGSGDPMFVRDPGRPRDRPLFAAPPGVHAHFPVWSPDQAFVYFVQGSVPDAMDIWRIPSGGGAAERLTHHNSGVSHPVVLDQGTLMYLATGPDGSGPWLHSLDLARRVSHRLSFDVDRYTSLAASEDGRRLVVTAARPRDTFWRLPISPAPPDASAATRVPLTTAGGFFPRLGPGYLLYASPGPAGDALWKVAGGAATELWSAPGARITGGPAISPDGHRIAFWVEQGGKTPLYIMNADGTGVRIVTDSLALRGAPAWAPDRQSVTIAVNDAGAPRLFSIPVDGRPAVRLVQDYSIDPAWSPDGRHLVFSGPDIGTTFPVKAVSRDGQPFPLPNLTLTRGARRLIFFPRQRALVVLRGDIQHKNLWSIDLATGAERQLTDLPRDFDLRDFDISPGGDELVLHRVQEQSDLVLVDLPGR